jgi:hypothetical protein
VIPTGGASAMGGGCITIRAISFAEADIGSDTPHCAAFKDLSSCIVNENASILALTNIIPTGAFGLPSNSLIKLSHIWRGPIWTCNCNKQKSDFFAHAFASTIEIFGFSTSDSG